MFLSFENCQIYLPLRVYMLFIVSNLSWVGWYLKVILSCAHSGLAIGFPYLKLSVNCVSF